MRILFIVGLLAALPGAAADAPAVRNGVADLRGRDLASAVPVDLAGEWRFSWQRFEDPAKPGESRTMTWVPGAWNDATRGGEGYATYRLTILCDRGAEPGLMLPAANSAMRAFVNGREVSSQGAPGVDAASTRAAVSRRVVALHGQACPLEVTLHVANFAHRHGGLLQAPRFGGYERVLLQRERGLSMDESVIGSYLLLGLLTVLFYLGRRGDPTPLWLGLYCFAMVAHYELGKEGVYAHLVLGGEAAWEPYRKADALALALATPFLALFIGSLYPAVARRWATNAIAAASAAAGVVILAFPARLHSHAEPFVQLLTIAAAAWMIGVLAIAAWRQRSPWALLLIGMAGFYPVVALDLLATNTPLRYTMAPVAMLCLLVAPAAVLARRFSRALNNETVQEQLRDQVALTDAIVRQIPIAVFTKDAEGRFTRVNRGWSEMSGVPEEKAVGRTAKDLYSPQMAERIEREDNELLALGAGAAPVEVVHRGPKPDQWRIVRKAVLSREDGTVQGLVCTSTDISELKRVEGQLADRVRFIGELVDTLPISLAMRDLEGRYQLVNRTWERYFVIGRDEVLGKRRSEIAGDDAEQRRAAEEIEKLDRELLERNSDRPLEPEEVKRLGRYYLITRRILRDAEGRPTGIISAGIDTTERREIEQQLELEKRRLDLVVRGSRAGIVDWDGVTHDTWYSPRLREILGHAADADTSQWPDYFKVLLHPEDRERFTRRWQAFIRGKGPEGPRGEFLGADEHRLLRKDGSYVWVEVNGVAVRDDKGFVTRWIASTADITERRAMERELAEQKAILETTLENIDQGITMIDRDLRIIAYNRRFLDLLEFPPEQFQRGFHLGQAFRYNAERGDYGPGDAEAQVAERLELARKFEPHYFERTRPNGQVLAIRGQPLPSGEGFVTTYSDITEHKRTEAELKASVRLREEVERMSRHDLKTPLNSVIAVSRLLREGGKLAREDAELLGTIERAGYRILNMVNLSLDLFRMEQGTYQFRPQALDLDEVAAKVATDLRSQAASKGVELAIERKSLCVASAEELLCYSMLANLVKNAIEAAPEGSSVRLVLERKGADALVHVHNGGAVPDEVRSRFFQKYATAGKSAGLGLGSYSARLMARVQEGELTLATSLEEGTTLTVRLRATDEPASRTAVRDEAEIERAMAPSELPSLRVLVVDDDEFNRLVLRRYLPTPPLKVTMAVNGRAALDAAAAEWPDVVLLDLEMPVMDGYEAATKLREMQKAKRRKPPVIVAISSNDEEVIVQRALAAGCDQYLVKPAPREVLWQILNGVSAPLPSGNVVVDAKAGDPVLLDADLAASLPAFLASRRKALEEMPAALAAGDRAQFRRLAHRLAGSFALYGFKWAAMQCRAIERDALEGPQDELLKNALEIATYLESAEIRVKAKA